MKSTILVLSLAGLIGCAHEPTPTHEPIPTTVDAASDVNRAPTGAEVRAAAAEVFGSSVGAENPTSHRLILDLAAVPKDARGCETKGGSTTCCGGNQEGVESNGVCCTFGGWSFSCERVTCKADGHCYDHEG